MNASSIVTIALTDPGEGLTEAEILELKVAVGDRLEINDPVVEVETAKSAVELPSHVAGTVVEILVAVGEEVPVGAPLLRVGGYHLPYPPSRMEHAYLPDLDRVLDGVDRLLEH